MDDVRRAGGRTIAPVRLAAYDEAGDPADSVRLASDLMRHLEAIQILRAREEHRLVRGATNLVTTMGLRLVTTPSATECEHERKLGAVDQLVASMDEDARAHIVALLQAALWADAARRHASSLPVFRRGLQTSPLVLGLVDPGQAVTGHVGIPQRDLDRYDAAVAITDTDHVLLAAIDVVRDLRALLRAGRTMDGALTILSGIAFGLCVEPAVSIEARLDLRVTLLILWRTIRKRRPLAAAVLRRRLALDRKRWPGPVRQSPVIGRA